MNYLKLLLIRHAQSIGNHQARMEGQQSTSLSALGKRQARALSQALTIPTADHPTHLYSSPLLRARQTTASLAQALSHRQPPLPIQHSPDLQEIHPGIFQGLTWEEATLQHPDLCNRLMTSLSWQPVPQAESPGAARDRAQRWINEQLLHHQPGDTVWAISHGGLMLQLISALMGCDRTWNITIGHTAIFEFWLASTHWETLRQDRFNPEYWIVRRFNDTAHLTSLA